MKKNQKNGKKIKVKNVLYDISIALIDISEKFVIKIKKVKFEQKIAIKNVNQSVVILVFTVIFFTYVATSDTTK